MQAPLQELCSRLGGVRRNGHGWVALCPAHEDREPSLSLHEGADGRALIHCHAGCSAEHIVAALGLELRALFPRDPVLPSSPSSFHHPRHGTPSKVWAVRYPDGRLFAHHVRFELEEGGKVVLWHREGRWGLLGKRLVAAPLYGSERLHGWDRLEPVFLHEGQKAADAGRAAGLASLGTVTGASGTPGEEVLAVLDGFTVVLWPDNDTPGREHMVKVGKALAGVARAVRILDPEALGLPEKGDAVEWFAAHGGTPEGVDSAAEHLLEASQPFRPPHCTDAQPCYSCYSCYTPATAGVSAIAAAATARYSDPDPVPLHSEKAAPYPVEHFPPLLREAAEAIHSLTLAPMALCAHGVLAVASVAVQRLADVELPTGQIAPTSLYLLSVARSGERKSSVDRWATRPLMEEEERQEHRYQEECRTYEVQLEAWHAQRAEARKDGAQGLESRLEDLGPEPQAPTPAGLIVGLGTTEGILSMLEPRDAVGLFSDEGGSFLAGYAMARENDRRIRTAAVLSSLWDGQPIREERRGGSLRLGRGKRLALHLLVQPVIAERLLGDPEIDGQGLLSRLLLVEPDSTIGTRQWREPDPQARATLERFNERVGRLLAVESTGSARRTVTLTPEARQAWIDFHNRVEKAMAPEALYENIRNFAAKAPEHAARLAAVLAVFSDLEGEEIHSLTEARALMDYYLEERRRLTERPTEPHIEAANRLVEWLQKWPEDWISLPDILQRGPAPLRRRRPFIQETLLPLLLRYGHLEGPPRRAEIQGRPRQQAYRVIRSCSGQ